MSKFKVVRHVDAYVQYLTTVEAETAQEAWDSAHADAGLGWEKGKTVEYDNSLLGVYADDGSTLVEGEE